MTDGELRPRLRPLEIIPIPGEGLLLRDPAGFFEQPVFVAEPAIPLLQWFDGDHTLLDLQTLLTRATGEFVSLDQVLRLVGQFDELLILDSERFHAHRRTQVAEFRALTVRPASHAGESYPADPAALQACLDGFYADAQGAGVPPFMRSGNAVRAVMAPHIDLRAGGPTYTHAYRALAEGASARTVVVLGVAHAGAAHGVAATAKDFDTPLGPVRTDRAFLDALAARLPFDPFHDEFVHRGEHSVEFQAVFLRHLFGDRVSLVPLLLAGFHEPLRAGLRPEQDDRLGAFFAALRETLTEWGDNAVVLLSVDLAHVGPRFGDEVDLTEPLLEHVAAEDLSFLQAAEALDPDRLLAEYLKDNDSRRVDGFPGLYTLLQVLALQSGKLLAYDQTVSPESGSAVSFASMAFG